MIEERLPIADLLAKAGDGDFLRSVAEAVLPMLMKADAEGMISAERHERTGERTNYCNGYRDHTLDTQLGNLQLRIPNLRQGRYLPPFPEPCRTTEEALVAVIQKAWVSGVSTRRVDDPVQAMGVAGVSKSAVSKLCHGTVERVGAFLNRPLADRCRRLVVSLARRHLPQAARARAYRLGRGENRLGRQHRRPNSCRP